MMEGQINQTTDQLVFFLIFQKHMTHSFIVNYTILYQPAPVNVRGSITESNNCEKLLGIYIDSKFSFKYHINRICRKASQKFYALSKVSGQLLLRKIAPWIIALLTIAPWMIAPRIIAPLDNCPRGILLPG